MPSHEVFEAIKGYLKMLDKINKCYFLAFYEKMKHIQSLVQLSSLNLGLVLSTNLLIEYLHELKAN